jgi:hypothetical protein
LATDANGSLASTTLFGAFAGAPVIEVIDDCCAKVPGKVRE